MRKISNPNQLSLFDILKDLRPKDSDFSSINIDLRLRETISRAIKESPYSRIQIAAKMADLLDVEITKSMLDSWTAESREGLNRFPACYLPAFCQAIGTIEPLRILADPVGSYVVQGEEALRIELSKIEEQKQKIAQKERAIKIMMQGMRG